MSYLLWRFLHHGETPARLTTARGLVPAAALVAFSVSNLAIGLWCLLLACVVRHRFAPDAIESRFLERTVCSRAALYLGKISYSLYLGHWPVAIVCLAVMSPLATMPYPLFAAAYIVVAGAMSIGLAALLFHTVEAPAIRWAKNKFREPGIAPALAKAVAPA
jgi:peptidoglycan/LPS O-acetylase OafA/YrhL